MDLIQTHAIVSPAAFVVRSEGLYNTNILARNSTRTTQHANIEVYAYK